MGWASYVAGALFAAGWLLIADGSVYANYTEDPERIEFGYWVPGGIMSIALVMLNVLDRKEVSGGDWFSAGGSSSGKAKAWLFLTLVIAFGCLIAAFWIAGQKWFATNTSVSPPPPSAPLSSPTLTPCVFAPLSAAQAKSQWPGASIILHNALIFASMMVWWLWRVPPSTD